MQKKEKLKETGLYLLSQETRVYVFFQERKFYRSLKMEEEIKFFRSFMLETDEVAILYNDNITKVRTLKEIAEDEYLIDAYNFIISDGGIVIPVDSRYHVTYTNLMIKRLTGDD